jgi:hypothetical protein
MKARIAVVVYCAVVFFVLVDNRARATQYSITGSIEQNNPIGGPQTYRLGLYLSKWLTQSNLNEDKVLEVISPSGQRFQELSQSIDGVYMGLNDLTLANLNSSVIGNWTFEETLGGVTKRYSFTIPAIPSQMFTTPIPVITSPSEGDLVKKLFDVKWQNAKSNQQSFRWRAVDADGSVTERPDIQRVGTGHATFSYANYPNLGQIDITEFSTSVEVGLHRFQLTKLTSNGDATLTSLNFLEWEVRSPEIAFSVIPEPASLLLLGLAIACAADGRGFVRMCDELTNRSHRRRHH